MPRQRLALIPLFALAACAQRSVGDEADDVGELATSEDASSSTGPSDSSDSTTDSSSTDSSSTDSSDSTTDSSSTDSSSSDSSDSSDSTDTGINEGPVCGDQLEHVIGSVQAWTGNANALEFVRVDGSRSLVRESLGTFTTAARGDRVFVAEQGECAWASLGALVDRNDGSVIWDNLDLPYGFAGGVNYQADGRIVVDGYNYDVPSPYFMIVDESGVLLDSGYGEVWNLRIRPDDWIPLYRPYYEQEPAPQDKWRWRKVGGAAEIGPTYPPNYYPTRFNAAGELVYATDIGDVWTIVVEAPGQPTLIDAPILDQLVDAAWQVRLVWESGYELKPHGYDSDWTLIRAEKGSQDRLFVLNPDAQISEVDLTPPTPEHSLIDCWMPSFDEQDRLLLAWLDGDGVAQVWRRQDQQWSSLGLPLVETGTIAARQLAGTYYLRANTDSYDHCDDAWGPAPADAIVEQGSQYLRGGSQYVVPNDRILLYIPTQTLQPSGRCVASFDTQADHWLVHDLDTGFELALEVGMFQWFAD